MLQAPRSPAGRVQGFVSLNYILGIAVVQEPVTIPIYFAVGALVWAIFAALARLVANIALAEFAC